MGMSRSARIKILLVIDTVFFFLEIIVGYAVHSLALVADSFHMLNDVFSLLVALWAIKLSKQKSTSSYTYGWQRAEVLGALVNGVFLLALCLSIFLEAVQRFFEPQVISNPVLILVVGSCGLASNIFGLFLFHDHSHSHGHSHGDPQGEHSHTHEDVEAGHNQAHAKDGSEILNEEGPIEEILPETVVARTVSATKVPSKAHETGASPVPSRRRLSGVSASPFTLAKMSGESSRSHGHRHSGESRHRPFADPATNIHVHPAQNRQDIINAASPSDHEGEEGSVKSGDRISHPQSERGNNMTSSGETSPHRRMSMSGHSSHHHSRPDLPPKESNQNLNMRGVFLHVLGDALGNVAVIFTALVIWKTDFSWRFYFDPVVSLIITAIIFCSALPLVKSASKILLQAVPKGISLEQVKEDILSIKDIESIHELHIWQLSDVKLIASLHIQVTFDPEGPVGGGKYMKLAGEIRKCLHAYGIHSSTIQPEYVRPNVNGSDLDGLRYGNGRGGDGNDDGVGNAVSDESEATECLMECGEECGGGKCCGPMVVSEGHGHSH